MGAGSNLFLTVDIDVLGDKELMQLGKLMQQTGIQANNMNSVMNEFVGTQKDVNKNQKEQNQRFGDSFGKYMNLMFAGMALNMVFGRMRKTMLKMTGASEALGVAMKSTLLPIFLAINPAILSFANTMIALPRPAKMLVGVLFLLASALALLMFVGGQAGLFWDAWGESIKGAAGGLRSSMAPALATVKTKLLSLASALKTAIMSTITYVASAVSSAIAATYSWAAANSALLATIGSILLVVGSLVLGVMFLNRIFKKFGPVVGLLATVLGGTLLAVLSPIAAAVFSIYGAFKAVNKIFKKFGNVIGTLATVVVVAVAALLTPIIGLPVAIGVAVGALVALVWNLQDEIAAAFKNIGKGLSKLPEWFGKRLAAAGRAVNNWKKKIVRFFEGLWGGAKKQLDNLIGFIKNLPGMLLSPLGSIHNAMLEIGKSIVNGVVDGMTSIGGSIADAFFNMLPGPLSTAVKGISKFGGGLVSGIQDVLTPNDFILTGGGKMIQPASNDTIVGFNGNGPIQPGAGGGGEVTVNINDPVMKEDVDVQRVVDEVEERVNRDTRGRTGGLGT